MLALLALMLMVCATGAVPPMQLFVALLPGVIVMVQLVFGARLELQVDPAVVPVGQVG